jgi:hypothetical protein
MAEKKRWKRGHLQRVKTPPARREEAIRLLRTLAERETDLGAKGYAEGAAESIEAGGPVNASYVKGLRRAVAAGPSDTPKASPSTGPRARR